MTFVISIISQRGGLGEATSPSLLEQLTTRLVYKNQRERGSIDESLVERLCMGCSFYRVINGGILLSKSHSQAESSVQSASRWRQRGICQSTDRSSTTIWSLSLRKRYQSRCPNSFVQKRTTTKLLVKWRSGRGQVNDWGQKVCESRSQGQRERRRGLIEWMSFHADRNGGSPRIFSFSCLIDQWCAMRCFARRIIHGEGRSQHDLLGQVWLKHSNQPNKTSNGYYWNEIGI